MLRHLGCYGRYLVRCRRGDDYQICSPPTSGEASSGRHVHTVLGIPLAAGHDRTRMNKSLYIVQTGVEALSSHAST
jgi:hypothetical protein